MNSTKLYNQYVSTHFRHGGRLKKKFLEQQLKYFEMNFKAHLPSSKSSRIVDLGCGLGYFLRFVQTLGYKNIIGVDASAECVDFCRQQKITVALNDLLSFLERTTEKIDVIVMNDVLEHQSKDRLWKLLEVMRVQLNEGGKLIIKVPNMSNPILGLDSRYLDITHEIGFTASSIKQVLGMAGFSKVKVYESNIYVGGTIVDWLASRVVKVLNIFWRILFKLYGRTSTTIFSKHLIVTAIK
jgi:2-polyprenyl-3-methyl-5-hydroxy-6-metoxy-1,4-benzoquinol methylase